jgi:hypothetical protein
MRSSSEVSTVMMGWRELTSSRNSSCLLMGAGCFPGEVPLVRGPLAAVVVAGVRGGVVGSFDKAARLVQH